MTDVTVLIKSSEFTRSRGLIMKRVGVNGPASLRNRPGFTPGNNNVDSPLAAAENGQRIHFELLLEMKFSPFKINLPTLPNTAEGDLDPEGVCRVTS